MSTGVPKVQVTQMIKDVYDGREWKKFQHVYELLFMYALMLNVHWFQPYAHTVTSTGVIHLAVMNLP